MRAGKVRARVSVTALAIVWAAQAHAADQAATEAQAAPVEQEDSQVIIVTAQKREQAIQDIPASVSSLGTEALEQRGIRDVQALQFQTPSIQSGNSVGITQISIRGVGMNVTTPTTQPGVGVYVDGVYQTRTALGGLSQLDLARVEVLRGPQGTLYGRNATGGAVNFITASPSNKFEGFVLAGYAGYDDWRLQGLVNLPVTDRLRTRLTVEYHDQNDGFVKNVIPGSPDVDSNKSLMARLKVAADLSDNATFELSAFGGHGSGAVDYLVLREPPNAASIAINPALAFAIVPSEDHRTSANRPSKSDRDTWGFTGTFSWDVGPARLKSITGYYHSKYMNDYDGDGTNLDFVPVRDWAKSDSLSQEFNLSGDSGPVEWLAGLYYLHDKFTLNQRFDFPIGFPPFFLPPSTFLTIDATPYKTKAYAAFADGSVHLNEKLKLLAGARYSKEKQDVTQSSAVGLDLGGGVEIPLFALCSDLRTKLEFESFTPRGGVQYDFDDSKNAYLTVSRGFKAGGVNESACTDNIYKPEKITAYEAGVRTQLANGRVTLNATAFHYNYTNFQVQQILGLQALIVNAPKATVNGLEIETLFAPNRHWSINANLALLDSEYGEGFYNTDVLNRAAGVQDVEGNQLNRSPKASGNIGLQYRTGPLSFGELTARGDLYLTSRYYFREFNSPEDSQDGYALVNLNLIWDSPGERFQARLYANNLFDANYITTLGANENVGARFMTWGTPRQLGVELRARF
jgi:iron complex outermembrane receptor protein